VRCKNNAVYRSWENGAVRCVRETPGVARINAVCRSCESEAVHGGEHA
jgi:hypothetical protein